MEKFEIRKENGKLYLFAGNGYGTTYKFEIVDSIPLNYEVWNIPEIVEGDYSYVPLLNGLTSKDYCVDTSTLKCIMLLNDDAKILHKAASCGVRTVKDCKKALSRVAKSYMMKRKQEQAKKALPILEAITY